MTTIVKSVKEVQHALGRVARRAVRIVRGKSVPDIVARVRRDGLTYLGEDALFDLHDQVRRIEEQRLDGTLIEAGCALGGSAIVMAAAKTPMRPLAVYDVFGMIPPPSEQDDQDVHDRYREIVEGESKGIQGDVYYGYQPNLYEKVKENFSREGFPIEQNNVELIRGLFQDTLRIDGPIALAHIDGDWYDSVMTCLERIEPRLASGGALIIDDYHCWSGCRKAVDTYFEDKRDRYDFVRRSRLHIIRR